VVMVVVVVVVVVVGVGPPKQVDECGNSSTVITSLYESQNVERPVSICCSSLGLVLLADEYAFQNTPGNTSWSGLVENFEVLP
jgi:hypothetical protein